VTLLTFATRRLVRSEGAVPVIAVCGTMLLIAVLFVQELLRALEGTAGQARLRIFRAILIPQLLAFMILVITRLDLATR
jgi:hypothetical protein